MLNEKLGELWAVSCETFNRLLHSIYHPRKVSWTHTPSVSVRQHHSNTAFYAFSANYIYFIPDLLHSRCHAVRFPTSTTLSVNAFSSDKEQGSLLQTSFSAKTFHIDACNMQCHQSLFSWPMCVRCEYTQAINAEIWVAPHVISFQIIIIPSQRQVPNTLFWFRRSRRRSDRARNMMHV